MVKKYDINKDILDKIDELTNDNNLREFLKEALQTEYKMKNETDTLIGKSYLNLIEKYKS